MISDCGIACGKPATTEGRESRHVSYSIKEPSLSKLENIIELKLHPTFAKFVGVFLLIVLIFIGFRYGFFASDYSARMCDLKKRAVQGRIREVYQSKELLFYIDTIKEGFPMHFYFDRDNYREFYEVSKGENYMLPQAGDSIFKKANSRFVTFKRGDKIFIEEMILRNCN